MKIKNILLMGVIAVIGFLGFTNVNAASISDNGKYSLVLSSDDWDCSFDGEYAKIIRFNVSEGETTVKISELTKGVLPYNGKNEFSHWENSDGQKVDEVKISDFTFSGNFYTSQREEINYTNGLVIKATFEGKSLQDGENYYITFDAFAGTINGYAKMLLVNKKSEFKSYDLKNYVPVREGYTFIGWDLDGKIVTSIDESAFAKNVTINLVATYTKNTFSGDDRIISLNANGGTIDGETIKKYDYLSGADSGTSMSLLPYVPVREGYTFNGWNSKADGSGKNYTYMYWRLWDKDDDTELEKDTLFNNSNGYELYQNITLYASWTKNAESEEKVKEIQSTGEVKATIEFEDEVSKNHKLDIVPVEVNDNLLSKNVKYIFDINVLENGEVIKVNGTKMTIKIALPEELKEYKKYEVVYILNGEIKETIPAVVENGYIVFETTHLSQYGIVATEKESNTNVENPETGDNIMFYIVSSTISILGLIGTSISIYKRYN